MNQEQRESVARFRNWFKASLQLHFSEVARRDKTLRHRNSPPAYFSLEIYDALRTRALYADQYAESLLQTVTLQFQIACGRKATWDRETFTSLPTAVPNQSGVYAVLFETPQTADHRFGPTGLDLYCGQANGPPLKYSPWKGLPLRLKTYEQQSAIDPAKLQAMRRTSGERGKTLHVYMLCSIPGVRFHSRVIALAPQLKDTESVEETMRDLTILESILVLLLGTMMSPEGQAAYDSPIRWMPHAADWGRETRSPSTGCHAL